MKRAVVLVAVLLTGPSVAWASDDAAGPNLFRRALESAALVCWSNHGTDGGWPRAGAVVLDRGKRLVLAAEKGMPDATFVLFPLYTAKGEVRSDPNVYVVPAKAEERWKGKVVRRDKVRGLAVIELDRALPDRAREAEFATASATVGSVVYSLGQSPDEKVMWGLARGTVREVGNEVFVGSGPSTRRVVVTATTPRGTGPECGQFDPAGRAVGLAHYAIPGPAGGVCGRIDVTEIRAFLTENKVPFRTAPADPAPKADKPK
jgi:hypothetical protein